MLICPGYFISVSYVHSPEGYCVSLKRLSLSKAESLCLLCHLNLPSLSRAEVIIIIIFFFFEVIIYVLGDQGAKHVLYTVVLKTLQGNYLALRWFISFSE